MTDPATDDDVLGPIDIVILEFSGGKLAGETAGELLNLIESGIIRLYDLLVVRKDADGTFSGIDLTDVDDEHVGGLTAFAGARSGLLGDDDIKQAADAMEPGTVAALIVYENRWAERFVAAAVREGGRMIATTRIPAQDVLAVLDALEA
jgi:uncharacterized membrane protein